MVTLLHAAAEKAGNRLSQSEWDDNSWSATKWMSYATQRLSVALHKTVAREALEALGLVNVSCVVGSA